MLTWKLTCPHCGGPNKVAAARHCLACEFCGAGLWVRLPAGYPTLVAAARMKRREAVFAWDRYLKTHDQPLSQSQRRAVQAYLPFWRVSGLVAMREEIRYVLPVHEVATGDGIYSTETPGPGYREERRPGEWSVRPRDITIPAFADAGGGLDSLGVRVETVPLGGWHQAKVPEDAWRVAPTVGGEEALRRFDAAACAILEFNTGVESPEHFLITPQLALVYWPVWQLGDEQDDGARGVEIDAVNGRIIRETAGVAERPGDTVGVEGETPALLPHRCPECGDDLPVDLRQVVFLCGNCRSLTAHTSCGERTTVRAECADGRDLTKDAWYPFWCFEGASRVLVPAFAIRNYRHLVRFGAMMSGRDRQFVTPLERPRTLVGVALPPDVAAGLAEVICRRRKTPSVADDAAPPRLVYSPLQSVGPELVDPGTGLCLRRAALAPT